jgi:cellulose synthase (UDP-forming)
MSQLPFLSPAVSTHTLAVPPSDEEKLNYVQGPQHRWFFWAHLLSFAGIAFSLYGFARMQYWTLIFLVPLAFYAAETLLGLRTSTYKRRITYPDHQFLVESWTPDRYDSVDVFLPTAGEDLDLLENTYRYVRQIEYPGRWQAYVLDDMARPQVEALASRYGFGYFARPTHEFKKAGNLRYASERTNGDHILILDADFVPRADILTDLVPYMGLNDSTLGIVQSPQYFPTAKSMGWIERCAGATQEMFYRFIQPSRDAVKGAICVGTSALYRREALDAIGGFPKIGHSEDVFTGFEMTKHGYHLLYVPINLTQGVCPDRLDPFITQQYRWCEGSMELVKGREFHEHQNLTQCMRLSFWAGFLYYFTTAINVFFAPLPVLIMVWLFPQFVHPENMLPLTGLLMLWLVVYPLLMKGRWRLDVLRVQVVYGFTHAVAIYDVFFGRTASWVPSHGENKATPLAMKVKRIMGWYITVAYGLVVLGIAYRMSPVGGDYVITEWWSLIAFTLVNFYVFGPVAYESFRTLRADRRTNRVPALPALQPNTVERLPVIDKVVVR